MSIQRLVALDANSGCRQGEPEDATLADFALDADLAALGFDGEFTEGQAQAGGVPARLFLHQAELLKD